MLLGLQDMIVKPGMVVRLPLRAVDPEGQPVRFYKRAGEPGELDGNLFTFKVPRKGPGRYTVTVIASDVTAGNSYAAAQLELAVKPAVHAHIDAKTFVGPAPFTLAVTNKGSRGKAKTQFGWEFYTPAPKRKAVAWKDLVHGETATHTFAAPGLYEVALTARSGDDSDRQTVSVWVTDGAKPASSRGVLIEGNGVSIAHGDETASAFDHTHFGTVREGAATTHVFEIYNRGTEDLACSARTVTIGGEHAPEFRIVSAPRRKILPGGYGTFAIDFRPKGEGTRSAEVTVRAAGTTTTFRVSGDAVRR